MNFPVPHKRNILGFDFPELVGRKSRHRYFGVEPLGGGGFRVASVRVMGGIVSAYEFGEFRNAEEARDVLSTIGYRRGRETVLAVPRREVILKWVRVPAVDPDEIKRMVPHEARVLAPWPELDGTYAFRVCDRDDDGYSTVMIVLAPIGLIGGYLDELAEFGLSPTRVEVSTLSLGRLLDGVDPDERMAIARVDSSGLEFARYRDGEPMFSRGMSSDETLQSLVSASLALDERKHGAEESCTSLLLATEDTAEGPEGFGEHASDIEVVSFDAFHPPVLNGVEGLKSSQAVCVGAALGGGEDGLTENLLPKRERLKLEVRALLAEVARLAATVACLGLLLFFVGQHYFSEERDHLARTRDEIEAIRQQVGDLDVKSSQMRIVKSELATVSLPLEVVLELYERTPNDIAVNRFHYDAGGSVTLGGEAKSFESVHAFLGVLNGSELFDKVELKYSSKSTGTSSSFVDFRVVARIDSTRGGV